MIRTRSTKDSRRNRQYVCALAQQRGEGCQTRTVTEVVIKAAVIRQIQMLGSDPRIVARGLAKAEEQRLSSLADLTLERQAAQRELTSLRAELNTITTSACTDQPATNGMSDLQYRIDKTECRLVQLIQELGILEAIVVDDDDFRAALATFNPVWESLNSREQARIIVILIDRIVYNGETRKATVSFRSAGFRNMCRGTAEARRN
jgi:site-specific DNA recombinase